MSRMSYKKIDPVLISTTCSPRHIQSVIEDLIKVIHNQNNLAEEVLKLNSDYRVELDGHEVVPIGAGRMLNLQKMAKDIVWD